MPQKNLRCWPVLHAVEPNSNQRRTLEVDEVVSVSKRSRGGCTQAVCAKKSEVNGPASACSARLRCLPHE